MSNRKESNIQILKKYNVLDVNIDKLFDDIVVLATEGCDKPFAMISLINANTRWVASQMGSFPSQILQENVFSALAVTQTQVLAIFDTLLDDRTKQSESVVKATNIRYYAGVPLINSDNQTLGTLCVFDINPNTVNQHRKSMLKLLAKDVVSQLELRRKNYELSKLKTFIR
jgi:GAF domain-containing protein